MRGIIPNREDDPGLFQENRSIETRMRYETEVRKKYIPRETDKMGKNKRKSKKRRVDSPANPASSI
jgi:hypothetical protein